MTAAPTTTPDLFCLRCGYNQRGNAGDRCPECGQSHADSPPSPVRLPWAHRRHLGRLRAYWRTVLLACFRPSRIVAEMEHPVTLADAHAFRRMTILHVLVPWALLALLVYLGHLDALGQGWINTRAGWFYTAYVPIWPVAPIFVGLWGFLHIAFSIPGEFARSSRLDTERNLRSIALSHYACAPCAFMAIATPLAVVPPMLTFDAAGGTWFISSPLVATTTLMAILWWFRSISIPAATVGRKGSHSALVGFVLPLIWAAVALVMAVIVPAVIYITGAGIYSMFNGAGPASKG